VIGIVRFEKTGKPTEYSNNIVSWSDGTPEEITMMLDAHYKGEIDIAEYWAVGDTRTITLDGVPNWVTTEVQPEQTVDLVIIGFNHDDKADGSGKAAITVQTKNQLSEVGYIHPVASAEYSSWADTMRRAWCNYGFKDALPTWLGNLVKVVTKVTNCYAHPAYDLYWERLSTDDSVFLLSEFETFGSQYLDSETYGDLGPDGTQYEYMKTTTNRVKGGPGESWWLRSSSVDENGGANFNVVESDGSDVMSNADAMIGIAPAFCL
jgi:hypothetical protein